jgi:hypothetical protein
VNPRNGPRWAIQERRVYIISNDRSELIACSSSTISFLSFSTFPIRSFSVFLMVFGAFPNFDFLQSVPKASSYSFKKSLNSFQGFWIFYMRLVTSFT